LLRGFFLGRIGYSSIYYISLVILEMLFIPGFILSKELIRNLFE